VAGIMVADYIVLRKTRLDSDALYRHNGIYAYTRGFNLKAVIALVAGVLAALIGVFIPALHPLYDYAWFVGLFVSAASYLLLMSSADRLADPVPSDAQAHLTAETILPQVATGGE
jgi:NCS1 family nucleobase:cation symporter-1